VIPSIKDSFFPSVTSIIETRLAESGFNVILSNTSSDSTIERKKTEDLLAWRVDGLIVAPSQETGDASLFWELWQRKVPFVLIDRFFPDTPFYSVTTDDYLGATMVVEHLLSLGRRRIAAAGGSLSISTNKLRHAGYVESLVRNGILPDPALFVQSRPLEQGGYAAAERLMEVQPQPDALFCFSDPVAIGAMQFFLERGIRIPEDIALAGYADLDHSAMLRVPLTTVHQPRELLGQYAADMLLLQMEGKTPDVPQRKLPVELVIRESTVGSKQQ